VVEAAGAIVPGDGQAPPRVVVDVPAHCALVAVGRSERARDVVLARDPQRLERRPAHVDPLHEAVVHAHRDLRVGVGAGRAVDARRRGADRHAPDPDRLDACAAHERGEVDDHR
jgi:hypothetical protein